MMNVECRIVGTGVIQNLKFEIPKISNFEFQISNRTRRFML
jgi:hypothetical protein